QSFADSLTLAIARSAKSLLGADVEIRATRPLSPGSAAVVAGLTREGVAVTRVRELVAMAQAGAGPRAPVQLVELKAVEQGYPFYGRLVTDPDRPLASLVGHGKALVHPSLLTRLRLAVGDRIRIGVAVSVRAFVSEKLATIAVLKCLGAGWRDVLAIYLVQTALLGFGGSLAGAALGSALQPVLAPLLARLLPLPVDLILSPRAVL